MVDLQDYEHFMREALKQARIAYSQEEVPIGCIIVNPRGEIIAQEFNRVEQQKTQLAHAEMLAVHAANRKVGDWRLDGCWVFVTLEPCAACINILLLSRVAGIVYGAASPVFGFSLDKDSALQLYRKDTMQIVPHILHEECGTLMKQFFKEKRNRDRG